MQILNNGPHTIPPNNSLIQATVKGTLPLHHNLNPQALLFLNLESEFLLSIGQVCGNGCVALFDEKALKLYKNDAEISTF